MTTSSRLMQLLQRPEYYGKVNLDAASNMVKLCGLADWIKDEFDASSVSVAVGIEDNVCAIEVVVPDIILERGRQNRFFEDITTADFLSFSKAPGGDLAIRFGVKGFYTNEQ